MKKVITLILAAVMVFSLALTASASYEDMDIPVIESVPKNVSWPEGSLAYYQCVCSNDKGHEKYSYDWYIVYNGVKYAVGLGGKDTDPWRAFADFSGGMTGTVGNTVMIDKIQKGLNGAEIYCVVSSSDISVTSAHARISVGAADMFAPPEITAPAYITCYEGDTVDITVDAKCKSGNVSEKGDFLKYYWYETTTGELFDIKLMFDSKGNDITGKKLTVKHDTAGTYFYVCGVFDGEDTPYANFSYSNVITVEVFEKIENISLEVTKMPDRTEYTAGETFDPKGMRVRLLRSDGFIDLDDGDQLTITPTVFDKDGKQTVELRYEDVSTTIEVTVKKKVIAPPVITSQPKGGVFEHDEECSLVVQATASGKLAYQWYSSEENDTSKATPITGATAPIYIPPRTTGTVYYFCSVYSVEGTNTSAPATSNVAAVEYKAAETVTDTAPVESDTQTDAVTEDTAQSTDTATDTKYDTATEPTQTSTPDETTGKTGTGTGMRKALVTTLIVAASVLAAAVAAVAIVTAVALKKKAGKENGGK